MGSIPAEKSGGDLRCLYKGKMLHEGEPEEEEHYRMISEDAAEMGKILNAPCQW